MLTAIILVGSILLAAGFAVAWFVSPAFRQRIERPKHLFADQVRQYDEQYRETGGKPGAE
jgi:hypothetical protein